MKFFDTVAIVFVLAGVLFGMVWFAATAWVPRKKAACMQGTLFSIGPNGEFIQGTDVSSRNRT